MCSLLERFKIWNSNTDASLCQLHPSLTASFTFPRDIQSSLPMAKLSYGTNMFQWRGFMLSPHLHQGAMAADKHFSACSTDVFVASYPKCSTTWLKSLIFPIINQHSLKQEKNIPSPRLLRTHFPYCYCSLPESLKHCGFENLSFEETFERYCKDALTIGPFFETVLEYWKASKEMPERIMFLTYVEMIADTKDVVKQTSKTGFPNSVFFRKGVVGDWMNHFTPELIERLDHITQQNLQGSGFEFRFDHIISMLCL
ncbi:hypothetical protein AMTRI_Chr12g272790 [Amborella trichopoda]